MVVALAMAEITIAEAARRMGLSATAVRQRVEKGLMQGRLVTPRLYLVDEEEVERQIQLGRLKPGPRPGSKRKPAD